MKSYPVDKAFEQKMCEAITVGWVGERVTFPILHPKTLKYVSVTVTARDLKQLIRSKIKKALK